jgi:ATP-dependent RNA helicase DDX35
VVAVSDAHERSVSTDLLLGLLKKVQRVRRDLRVVIITTPPTAATFRLGAGAGRHGHGVSSKPALQP